MEHITSSGTTSSLLSTAALGILRRGVLPPNMGGNGRIGLVQHFAPGYIVLSSLVAVIGAACTLELLLRRTSNHGTWNVLCLVGAGVSFGAVSAFSMHFLGNQALTLWRPPTPPEHPYSVVFTLDYAPGFTLLSLVVPCVCMTGAFAVMGLDLGSFGKSKEKERVKRRARRRSEIVGSKELSGAEIEGEEGKEKQGKDGKKAAGGGKLGEWKKSSMWKTVETGLAWTMVDLPSSKQLQEHPGSKGSDVLVGKKGDVYRLEEEERRMEEERRRQQEERARQPSLVGLPEFPPRPSIAHLPHSNSYPNNLPSSAFQRRSSTGSPPETRPIPLPFPLPSHVYGNLSSYRTNPSSTYTPHDPLTSISPSPTATHFSEVPLDSPGFSPTRPVPLQSVVSIPNFSSPPNSAGLTNPSSSTAHLVNPPSSQPPNYPPKASVFPLSLRPSRLTRILSSSPSFLSDNNNDNPSLPLYDSPSTTKSVNIPPPPESHAINRTRNPSSHGRRFSLPQRGDSFINASLTSLHQPTPASPSYNSFHPRIIAADSTGMSWEEFESSYQHPNLNFGTFDDESEDGKGSLQQPPRRSSGKTLAREKCREDLEEEIERGDPAADASNASRRRPSASSHARPHSLADAYPVLLRADLGGTRRDANETLEEKGKGEQEGYIEDAAGRLDTGLAGFERQQERKGRWWDWLMPDVTREEIIKVVCAGTTCGFGIAGMHYLGQRSITSIPHIGYSPFLVVLSVIIACLAVNIALWIMFLVLRPKLSHNWFKKFAVSCVLGAATNCMHYVAMIGTSYAVDDDTVLPSRHHQMHGKRVITIIVVSLSVASCLILVLCVYLAQKQLLAHKSRRSRVALATAIFDDTTGQVLVSPEGMLPLCDIGELASTGHMKRRWTGSISDSSGSGEGGGGEKRGNWFGFGRSRRSSFWGEESSVGSSSLDIDLSPSHPAFIAALRSTWSWRRPNVAPPSLDPSAAAAHVPLPSDLESRRPTDADESVHHLGLGVNIGSHPGGEDETMKGGESMKRGVNSVMPVGSGNSNAAVSRFGEKFALAVAQLATLVTGGEQGARKLGVLYDQILTTGHITFSSSAFDFHSVNGSSPSSPTSPSFSQSTTVSKGQLVILVSRLSSPSEKALLLRRGYLFVEPTSMARIMASTLAVPIPEMTSFVAGLGDFALNGGSESGVERGKVYAGVLVAQPLPFEGLKVIVDRRVRHQLPMKEVGKVAEGSGSVVLGGRGDRADKTEGKGETELASSIEGLGEMVASFAGVSLLSMMAAPSSSASPLDTLRSSLVEAIIPLLDRIPRETARSIFQTLVIIPSLIPLTPTCSSSRPSMTSYLIVFRCVLQPTEDCSRLGPTLTWIPFKLYRVFQDCVSREAEAEREAAQLALAGREGGGAESVKRSVSITNARRPSRVQFAPKASAVISKNTNRPATSDGLAAATAASSTALPLAPLFSDPFSASPGGFSNRPAASRPRLSHRPSTAPGPPGGLGSFFLYSSSGSTSPLPSPTSPGPPVNSPFGPPLDSASGLRRRSSTPQPCDPSSSVPPPQSHRASHQPHPLASSPHDPSHPEIILPNSPIDSVYDSAPDSAGLSTGLGLPSSSRAGDRLSHLLSQPGTFHDPPPPRPSSSSSPFSSHSPPTTTCSPNKHPNPTSNLAPSSLTTKLSRCPSPSPSSSAPSHRPLSTRRRPPDLFLSPSPLQSSSSSSSSSPPAAARLTVIDAAFPAPPLSLQPPRGLAPYDPNWCLALMREDVGGRT